VTDQALTRQKLNKSSRWSTLTYRLAMLIAALLGISAVLTTTFAVNSVQDSLYEEVTQSMLNVHGAVATTIALEYQALQNYREATLENRQASLKDVAAPITESLDQLVAAVGRGELTQSQAQGMGLDMLRNVRFANEDYFFTYNKDMVAIGHPDAKFQGKYLGDMQDPNGQYVIRDLKDIAYNQGSGFYEYQWVRLDEVTPVPKIAYLFLYQPWDWMIGTGVYVDDIDQQAQDRLNIVKDELASSLADISFSQDSTFLVLDSDGQVVISPYGNVETAWLGDTVQGQSVAQGIVASAPSATGVVSEQVVTAQLRNGESERWVTNVSTFPDLGWYLVSAVPEAELGAPGRSIAIQQTIMGIVVLILGLGAGLLLSRRIVKPVETITTAARDLAEDRFEPDSLNAAAQRKDEVGELARTFQRMGKELIDRERKLREQVAKLKVQIDRSKLAQDVNEITESEYFQRIKAQAEELRKNKPGTHKDKDQ